MTLLRNCFIGADWPVGKGAPQASDRVLKKRLVMAAASHTHPSYFGLDSPARVCFLSLSGACAWRSGRGLSQTLRGVASGAKSDNGSECCRPPVSRNSPEGKMPAGFLRISEMTRRHASWDLGCAD